MYDDTRVFRVARGMMSWESVHDAYLTTCRLRCFFFIISDVWSHYKVGRKNLPRKI